MSAPRRDARARLATGGLLLIPLAALWLLASPRLTRHGGPSLPADTSGMQGGSPLPAARLAAGAKAQGEWTLLAVTRVGAGSGGAVESLPPAIAPPAGAPAAIPAVRGGGLGVWLSARGGIGCRTLTIPEDGRSHAYSFGPVSLVAEPGVYGLTLRWERPGQVGVFHGPAPYSLIYAPGSSPFSSSSSERPDAWSVLLVPPLFSEQFRVTAQPLSADGRPAGGMVHLRCQPVTASALFVPIPAGYSRATRQFQVTVARAGAQAAPGAGSWRLADLPPSMLNGPDAQPTAPTAPAGPFLLRAEAAVAADAKNADRYGETGVPTICYRLSARRVSPVPLGQAWALQLDRVTPQWSAPPPLPFNIHLPPDLPLDFLPLAAPDAQERALRDGTVGAAYPGQQHWIKIDGAALRAATHLETLTFHDADVVRDASFGGDRLVWQHPETETTSSGIAVTVLNGQPGKPGPVPQTRQTWWYDHGNAELLLAWRLPPDIEPWENRPFSLPRVAGPLHGAGPFRTMPDTLRLTPFVGAVGPPGAKDARPLLRAGCSFLRLSVSMPGMPLPRHLKTLTLQLTLREEQERRAVHLVVPVRPGSPPL